MTLSRLGAGVICGLAMFACRHDAALTPRGDQPAATRSMAASTAAAVTAGSEANSRYLVVFRGSSAGLTGAVERSGGRVEGLREDLGFAVVSGLSDEAASRLRRIAGVTAVEADIEFAIEEVAHAEAVDATEASIQSPTAPHTASQFGRQWNMVAIRAHTAWTAGFLGSPTVTVAILDTGIDYRWPDLAGRVDTVRSISLRPDEDARFRTWFPTSTRHVITDLNGHGTLVSSIVASNSNFFAGVTTRTRLFGVKVCIVFNSCSVGATLSGIVYAVDQGADIINMSLGGDFSKRAAPGFVSILNRVINYAQQRGTLIVVAAGNSKVDLDHDGNLYSFFCNAPQVMCVSATGPTAAPTVIGPFTNPDAFAAAYSNFGRSAISLAAPGGGLTTPVNGNVFVTGPCSSTALAWHQPPAPSPGAPPPPPVIDAPACPLPGLFLARGAGTSFASPHVAGAAALLVAQIGSGNPSQVRATLQQSADDLGQPGTDPFFGKGRLNVARALGAIP